jgi:hypothetical protein
MRKSMGYSKLKLLTWETQPRFDRVELTRCAHDDAIMLPMLIGSEDLIYMQFHIRWIQSLRMCDPQSWWREIKKLTG